jgi:hypothetical protein
MKKESDAKLDSIQRTLRAILGVLLLMFGYDHTPIGKSEVGASLAIIGLMVGLLIITGTLLGMVFRALDNLRKATDGDENESPDGKPAEW